eukprot:TRINITY_DN8950_c1_g3_i1.p1 TRINITY_DN8950_c1_g3~~TRINITY_DN8950_c1_g3_i1.p1  ORF type:complete len:708 (+),score=130.90 TRINITY_DN8950_c1_g3_i1:51-2174(+)
MGPGGNDREHEEQMINTLIKNIQLESPASEPLQKGRPAGSLGMLPGGGQQEWGVSVAPPTPESIVPSNPALTGRALPRPLSADMLAAGEVPISQQQRAATPTAQTNAFSDSPQATSATTQGIVLLPGTNIPAHLQETLSSPQKGPSGQSPQRIHSDTNSTADREGTVQQPNCQPSVHHMTNGHYQHQNAFMPSDVHSFHEQMLHEQTHQYGLNSEEIHRFHQQQEQAHLQHMAALQHGNFNTSQGMCPVWDAGQLVGYVRVGDQGCLDIDQYLQGNNIEAMYGYQHQQYMQHQQHVRHAGMDAGMYGCDDMIASLPQSGYALDIVNQQQRHMRRPPQEPQESQKNHVLSGIYELSDLRGKVVEFSRDQEGSRFIQKHLAQGCDPADRQLLFDEVLPRSLELVCDVFGNYVVQKLLELGSEAQIEQMSEAFRGHILELSLQTYGCRVIQKALDVMPPHYKDMVTTELQGNVPKCVQDQNGNHVIQKCIETMPEKVGFIVKAFKGNVQHLATHAYGCRVIQRLLEHCKSASELIAPILDEILGHVNMLVRDQYGNYVVQDLLIHGEAKYRYSVGDHLKGSLCELSKHKFASNVVEKIFQFGSAEERFQFLDELMGTISAEGYSSFLCMVKDQYANYVVQKLLDLSDAQQRNTIIQHIQPHSAMLRKFTYGKHIMSRIDRLLGNKVSDDEEEGGEQMQNNLYADPMLRKL